MNTELNFNNHLFDLIRKKFPDHYSVTIYSFRDDASYLNLNISKKFVIVYVYDHFLYDLDPHSIDRERYPLSTTIKNIHKLASNHLDKNFIVVTENEYVERELIQLSALNNLYIISTNYFVLIEFNQYKLLSPQSKKIDTDKTFLCLNRQIRPHRFFSVVYLFYKRLENFGIISFSSLDKNTHIDNNPILNSWSKPTHNKLTNYLENFQQSERFTNYAFLKEQVYDNKRDDNSIANYSNFDIDLRNYYSKCYIEIITMTTCVEPSFSLDEKYINSVFGFVFPIIIGSHKQVSVIRELGFDVFDDIVDHSYDNEPNPYYRLKYAIDFNNKLLRDKEFLKEKFTECIPRFEANVKHYNENLKEVLQSRVQRQLDTITF